MRVHGIVLQLALTAALVVTGPPTSNQKGDRTMRASKVRGRCQGASRNPVAFRKPGLTAWLVGLLMIALSSGALADWPTCIKEGNVDRRIIACTEVIEKGPSSGRMGAYSARAILHLAKGELDLAEEDLRRVLKLPARTDAERKLHDFAGSALRRIAVSQTKPAALRNPAPDPSLNETIVRLPLSVKLPSGATHKGEFVLTIMRPHGAGPFPAVIASHGYDALLRTEMGRNRMLGPDLVRRGFAVLAPTRIGHGVSAIPEDPERPRGSCEAQDHRPAVTAGIAHIQATIAYAAAQPWIDNENLVLLGGSAGGVHSLVAAGSRPKGVRAVVNFAGGEGGRLEHPGKPCNPAGVEAMLATAGRSNPIPTLWLYSDNDKLFGPSIPRQWHAAYVKAGGKAEFHMLPPLGEDGHQLFVFGRAYWMPLFDRFLASNGLAQRKAEIIVTESSARGVVFSEEAGNFRVMFPAGTTPLEGPRKKETDAHTWTAPLADGQYMTVAYSHRIDGQSPSIDAAIKAVGTKHGEISSITNIERHGLGGREVILRTSEGFILRWRFFVAGARLYQVLYRGKPGSENGKDVEAFLESFRLLQDPTLR